MRALIWLIGIFALAVGVTMLAGVNDGYVLVVLSPWRAQVSLNLFIVVLVVGVALIHLLLRMVTRTVQLPGRVARWRERLFGLMSHNAGSIARHFRLPDNGVVELGTRVQI